MKVQISDYIDKKDGFCQMPYILQVKYMAYFFIKLTGDPIFNVKNLSNLFDMANINKPSNIADICNRLKNKGIFIPKNKGYALHRDEYNELESEFSKNKSKREVSNNLRNFLPRIKRTNKKNFLDEAIKCYEVNSYRASIIMVWLLVVDHLYEYVLNNKLRDFNSVLNKKFPKKYPIKTKEDFNELKETHFIELCRSAKIISNDIKKILDEKLGIRNSCAHPNNISISESKATSFIEDLLNNIILKF